MQRAMMDLLIAYLTPTRDLEIYCSLPAVKVTPRSLMGIAEYHSGRARYITTVSRLKAHMFALVGVALRPGMIAAGFENKHPKSGWRNAPGLQGFALRID